MTQTQAEAEHAPGRVEWLFAARDSLRTGRLMTAWPLLQVGGFTLPWLISLAVPTPWKYWLWALGLALDLVMVIGRGEHLMDDHQREQLERRMARADTEDRYGRRGGRPREPVGLTEVEVDRAHLEERLGLFVIIVLGESVAALVLTAAQTEWTVTSSVRRSPGSCCWCCCGCSPSPTGSPRRPG